MKRSRKKTAILAIETAFILMFAAVFVFVGINLRPAVFTDNNGAEVRGWSFGDTIYLDTAVFKPGMDVEVDFVNNSIRYSAPVDEQQVRDETEQAVTLQFTEKASSTKKENDAKIAGLHDKIKELEKQVEELESQTTNVANAPATNTTAKTNTQATNAKSGTSATQTAATALQPQAETPAPAANVPTPAAAAPTPAPEPTPAPAPAPPAPSVDAGACIAEARAYAIGRGMTEDGSLNTGNAGFLNAPDITVLSQASVISDLKYCIDIYASYSPEDPSLVSFNIVQSGNLIYVLYC